MAHGLKYTITYCDDISYQEKQVRILELDYSGEVIAITGTSDPFLKTLNGQGEIKSGGIFPQSAAVNAIAKYGVFSLDDMYTTDIRKYKIEHYTGGQFDWAGFVIPNGFQEGWDNETYGVSIEASDQLSSLQALPFIGADGEPYGTSDGNYVRTFLWVLKECLKKTDLGLPIATLVDIKPLLTEEGAVLARDVAFFSGINSLITWDADNALGNTLTVGSKIAVSGGSNDGKILTVTSWSHAGSGQQRRIDIRVDEPVVDTANQMENVILTINNEVSSSTYLDPLANIIHDIRVYINEYSEDSKAYVMNGEVIRPNPKQRVYYTQPEGAMNCWDVLQNMCILFNVKIKQNKGRWEISRVNADRTDDGVYEWFIYDQEGSLTGREPFGETVEMPCISEEGKFRPGIHTVSMDRVFKRATVNYRFKYKTDGDTLRNFINNPDFSEDWFQEGDPVQAIPNRWRRIKLLPNETPMMVYKLTSDLPGGFTTGVMLKSFSDTKTLSNYTEESNVGVNEGDRLKISWWQAFEDGAHRGRGGVLAIQIYRTAAEAEAGSAYANSPRYDLINDGITTARGGTNKIKGEWRKTESDNQHFRFFSSFPGGANPGNGWFLVDLDVEPIPINGFIRFEILGAATLTPTGIVNTAPIYRPEPIQGPPGTNQETSYSPGPAYFLNNPSIGLKVTGFTVSKIVNPGNDAIPEVAKYEYIQEGNYTDKPGDAYVITADVESPDLVGGVTWNGDFIGQWDTWNSEIGWSPLCLLAAKSIVQLHQIPFRKIDGEFGLEGGFDWALRLMFEELPGARFVIMSGTINEKKGTFSGQLVQIDDAAQPPLPPDPDTEPIWNETGNTRCAKDENNVNTGYVEAEEMDINARSATYQQTRWVLLPDADVISCPIGEPDRFIWGADISEYDVENFQRNPFSYDNNTVTVPFTNDGTGKYLFFLHLASLGTLYSVLDVEGDETFSSWEELTPEVIDGDTYTVWRMKYVTGTFTALNKTFRWQ